MKFFVPALRPALFLLTLAACTPGPAPSAPEPTPAAPAKDAKTAPRVTDAWIGKWPGVEGTYMRIDQGEAPGAYKITIADLDGPKTFDGQTQGSTIKFTRDGKDEVIRAGNGVETGMKWFADKTDCPVVKTGEGFRRS